MVRAPLALLAAVLLAGCAFAPGMQLKVGDSSSWLLKERAPDKPVQEDGYLLVQLTPKVMAKLDLEPAHPAASPVPASWRIDPHTYNYRIGPGDILAVTVWDHPELTNPAQFQTQSADTAGQRVSPNGTMFFPYAGTLDVGGKTVEQVRLMLSERLKSYIQNPQVDVRVIGFRSKRVHVTGAVRTPKDLPITDVPLTLVDAINAAGGPIIGEPTAGTTLPEADLDNIRVIRHGQELHLSLLDIYRGRLDENIVLEDGDVVYVSDKRNKEIYVMGEVNKPGLQYPVRDHLSLAAAIQLSGGLNQESANAERIFVIRQGKKQPVVYHLNADDPSAMLLATRFQLAPHDVVFVSSANIARVRRVLTPIVQAAQIAFFGSNL